MELIKITDRISYLPGEQRTDRPLLYYIRGDRYSVAVDAGNSRAHVELFYSALTAAGLPLPKLTVLTHWHWDHTFGLPYIHGASIATAKTQEKLREAAQWAWTREAMDARERTGEDIAFCNGCIREEYADLSEICVQPADMGIDRLMALDLGGVTLHLIPTDSVHSRDAMLIWAPEEKALIAGDAECEDFYEGHGRANPERIAAYVKLLDSFDFDFYCYGHIPPVDRAGILREMAEMAEKYSYEITAVEEPDRRAAYAEAVLHAGISGEAGRSRISRYLNLLHAAIKGVGVFFSPMPSTYMPDSRRREARRVKSLSLETIQKPSTLPEYRMSIASMIIAESVAFLPVV